MILPLSIARFWSTEEVDDEKCMCVVCKEQFTNTNRAFNTCSKCPAKMHLLCLRDFLAKGTDSCVNCEQIPFPEHCNCQLVNFLVQLNSITNNKTFSIACKNCEQWYGDCDCLCLKCTSACKAKNKLHPI